jgi:hypothetical protein
MRTLTQSHIATLLKVEMAAKAMQVAHHMPAL